MKQGFLGIDIGSISTKGVVIDENKSIVAEEYIWTEGNPIGAVKRLLARFNALLTHHCIAGVGTTGSARRLIGVMLGADSVKNEITAHAVGTLFLYPDTATILEIGGQDSKIIIIEDGVVTDYAMNTLCAAGTGSFLSSQALRLGVAVEDFGRLALESKNPASIAARCTVFAESDLVHKAQIGYKREDIIAGLCNAVAANYLNNLGKGKTILPPVIFQGGVSRNAGVVRAFNESLGISVLVDPRSHLMGALGAAILASRAPARKSAFDIASALTRNFETRGFSCHNCANNCELISLFLEGKALEVWGKRCEM